MRTPPGGHCRTVDPETRRQLRRDRCVRFLALSAVVVFTLFSGVLGFYSSDPGALGLAVLTALAGLFLGVVCLVWLEVCHGESFLTRPRRLQRFGPSSPVTLVDDCTGWKVAFLAFDGSRVLFEGLIGTRYGVSAPARCMRGEPHAPPDPACTCGFWSYRSARSAIRRARREVHHQPATPVLLQVDLFGDVLEHTRGFRAAEQDVLGVYVPARCGCGRRSVALGPAARDPHLLSVYCSRCSPPSGLLTLAQVGGLLGTEVQWSSREV